MCSFCNFINTIFTVDNFWNIVQTILWWVWIYFAYIIAREQVELAKIQKSYTERQHKIDVLKHKENWARDDLSRTISQLAFAVSIADDDVIKSLTKPTKDDIYKSNLLIWLCKETIKLALEEYNNALDNNPMWYITTWEVKNISTQDTTKEEIQKEIDKLVKK